MANEKKDLKKLDVGDKKNVAGGDFYTSREGGGYYFPVYKRPKEGEKCCAWTPCIKNLRKFLPGIREDVHVFETEAEAKAAADAEGRRMAEERRIAAMQQGDEF